MRSEHGVTRNHIEVGHERVLPPTEPERIKFWTVVRGSLLPILVWTGVACFAYFVYDPLVALVLGGLFTMSFLVLVDKGPSGRFGRVGLPLVPLFGLRRRARHSVRCSVYRALGGVLDKSMAGF